MKRSARQSTAKRLNSTAIQGSLPLKVPRLKYHFIQFGRIVFPFAVWPGKTPFPSYFRLLNIHFISFFMNYAEMHIFFRLLSHNS